MTQIPLAPKPPDPGVRLSELIPFRSPKISIWRSKALLPIVVVGVTCLVLFGYAGSELTFAQVRTYMTYVALLILAVSFLVLYIYSGERKFIGWYAIPAAVTVAQLTYLIGPYIHLFREVLPGNTDATGFGPAFVGMFFGAGLMEETMKGVPTLLALGLALGLAARGSSGNVVTRNLAVQGPLDGLLMGAAAGAAFIFVETMTMYVPSTIRNYSQAADGHLMGIILMIPRIGKGVIGHMAYAGIFGYFIGLSATHPKAAWKLVPLGLLVASVLHAFWNSADELVGSLGQYVAAPPIALTFFACLLKARQLEASRIGGYIDGLSILALSPQAAPAVPVPAVPVPGGVVPRNPPGLAGAFVGAATVLERSVGVDARTTPPPPVAGLPAAGLSIGTPEIRYALASGLPIDVSALFAAAGVPEGVRGDIVGNPDGSLDLVNAGTRAWIASAPDGSSESVGPGMRVRAVPGLRLAFGAAIVDIQPF